ncbi:MAG: TonB-dependent receptor [Pseudomonadota bacterium]
MKSKITCALLAGVASIGVANAEETNLDEIVVTAAPLGRTADDLTQPVAILDKEALLTKAAASIGETLANEAGVSATYFGPVAGRPVIRGQDGPRISVLATGISTLDVADLSPDHAVPIEPLFADRVEIIRGPATLLYGSSAAGGVVNVIDNTLPTEPGESPFSGAFEARGDTAAGEQALAARLEGTLGSISWHLNGFDRESDDIEIDGFATADPAERPEEEESGTVLNSAGEADGFSTGATIFTDRASVGFSYSQYNTNYGLPGPEEEEEGEEGGEEEIALFPGPFIDLEQDRIDIAAQYEIGGAIESARLRIARNDYEHIEVEPSGEVATEFSNEVFETRLELVHAPIAGWRGAFGVQLNDRDFSAVGEEAFVTPTETRSLGLFLLEERETDFGRIEVGARIESLEHEPLAALPGYDETAFSLAGGLTWDIGEYRDISINLSHSERHPDAAELYSDGAHLATGLFEVGLVIVGADVEKELANNLDVAFHHHSDRLDMTLSAFYNDISDYTYRRENGDIDDGLPVAVYVQEDAQFYGFEAEFDIRPLGVDSPWSINLLADYVRGKTDNEDLPRIQPARLGVGLEYATPRWRATVDALYHAEQDDISSFNTDSFTMLGGSVTLTLDESGSTTWDLFFRASNLLDEDARRATSFRAAFVPLPGTSLHAGLRARFN